MNQIEKIIDIATWNRKEHFEHFSAFDDPFFGVTVKPVVNTLRQQAADNFISRVGSHNAERRGKSRHNGYGNDDRINKIADNAEAHAQRSNNEGKFANLRQAETA